MATFVVSFENAPADQAQTRVEADNYATEAGFVTFYRSEVGAIASFKAETVISVRRVEDSP